MGEADLSMSDDALLVEDGDEVGVGEVSAGDALVFDTEQGGELEDLIGFAVQQRPAFGVEFALGPKGFEAFGGIPCRIDADEHKAEFFVPCLGQSRCDVLEIRDDDGARGLAMGVDHRDDADLPT